MKTRAHLLLTLPVALIMAAPASAWHHKMAVTPYPMTGYAIPYTPAVAGGASMSLSMTMSGDVAGLLGPLMLRGILQQVIGPLLTNPNVNADVAGLAQIIGTAAGNPAAGAVAQRLITEIGTLRQAMDAHRQTMEKLIDTMKNPPGGAKAEKLPAPTPSAASDAEHAEARRLLAQVEARQNARSTAARTASANPDSDVSRLLTQVAARQAARPSPSTPAGSANLSTEDELQQLLRQITVRQAVRRATAGNTIADRGK